MPSMESFSARQPNQPVLLLGPSALISMVRVHLVLIEPSSCLQTTREREILFCFILWINHFFSTLIHFFRGFANTGFLEGVKRV